MLRNGLYVCECAQNMSKCYECILLKFSNDRVGRGSATDRLDSDGDPDPWNIL